MLQICDCCIRNDVYKPGGCSCLSGIVFILTAQLLHSCLGTITTSVFRLSVQVHRVRRSTGRSDVQVKRVRRSTGRSGVQVNRVRRSTGRSGVQVYGVRRSVHVEGRNYAALLEIGASPRGRCPSLPLSLFSVSASCFTMCTNKIIFFHLSTALYPTVRLTSSASSASSTFPSLARVCLGFEVFTKILKS